jgi:hypothetical protein
VVIWHEARYFSILFGTYFTLPGVRSQRIRERGDCPKSALGRWHWRQGKTVGCLFGLVSCLESRANKVRNVGQCPQIGLRMVLIDSKSLMPVSSSETVETAPGTCQRDLSASEIRPVLLPVRFPRPRIEEQPCRGRMVLRQGPTP